MMEGTFSSKKELIMEFELGYGKTKLKFELPDERVVEKPEPRAMKAISDPEGALTAAMESPVGPRLEDVVKPGNRVLVLTVDFTRPNPSPFLWPVVEKVRALGATAEVMIALGNHRPMTDSELKGFIGTADVLQNDAKGKMWKLGTTRHGTPIEVDHRLKGYDVRLAVGFVEPSYLLGYTGGRKILMPGVASSRAIARNHFMLLEPGRKLGVQEGNPLAEDALDYVKAVGLQWIVDVVVNPDDTFATVYCGDAIEANIRAVRDASSIYETPVNRQADVVIASAGGHPYDFDLVQTKKSVVPAIEFVREGGVIIFIGACPDRWGCEKEVSREALMNMSPEAILTELRQQYARKECPWENVPCSSKYLFSLAAAEKKARLIAVTGINDDLSQTFVETAKDIPTALRMAESSLGKDATVTIISDGRRIIPVIP